MKDRTGVAIAAAFAGVVLVAGCSGSPSYAGKVIDRDIDTKTTTKKVNGKNKKETKFTYELTTSTEGGQTHEFKVSSTTYYRCQVGASYPACK